MGRVSRGNAVGARPLNWIAGAQGMNLEGQDTMQGTARCACGAASILVQGEPVQYIVCHCTNCKRRTGSAFGISASFQGADVTGKSGATHACAFHHDAWNGDQVQCMKPTPDHSMEPTCHGKPGTVADLGRWLSFE